MTIIVTGGAGFIGGNFVHYMLKTYPEDRIVCVDKLTYAGNMSTLAPVMADPRFRFCKTDICDREGIYEIFEQGFNYWDGLPRLQQRAAILYLEYNIPPFYYAPSMLLFKQSPG